MSKLRKAVSRAHLKLLARGVEREVPEAPPPTPEPSPEARQVLRARRKRRARAVEAGELPANENAAQKSTEEPEAIRDARRRLRAMIALATQDAPRPSVGIVLAIVNQETGNHAAANALIDEMGLDSLFGIKKFSPQT